MASVRSNAYIARPADEVWKAVSDPAALVAWFPGVTDAILDGSVRAVSVEGGTTIHEEIVTNDASLRRFQYRMRPGPIPVESHLATVDVLDYEDGAIIVFSADVSPDVLGAPMQKTLARAVQGLKRYLEAG